MYGKASKLTDVVMFDIKQLKVIKEGDNKRFIELVDAVEREYRDLERLSIQHEISNSTTVSMIEEKLSRDVRQEWSNEVNHADTKVDNLNNFPSLLKFFLEQKRIIEYESADLCCSGSSAHGVAHYVETTDDRSEDQSTAYGQSRQPWCIIHTLNNHSTSDCRVYHDKLPEQKLQFIKEKRACIHALRLVTDHLTASYVRSVQRMAVTCFIICHPTLLTYREYIFTLQAQQ